MDNKKQPHDELLDGQGKINTDQVEETEGPSNGRQLTGWVRYLFLTIAVAGALFHLYILNFHPIDPWVFRSTHLVFGAVLGFLLFPGWRGAKNKVHPVDWVLILATIFVGYYIFANLNQILFRFGVAPTTMDFIVALTGLLLVFELTRRTSGWMLPLLAGLFVLYVLIGPWLPGILNHSGYRFDRFVTYVYGLDGVFGVTLDVSSKYIVLFIIFGAFLQMSRVGNYFMDVAFAVAGGLRGGPAKVAVFSSGLMGMMNGTSAGNAVATGSLTIPLMKRVGYQPKFAAATEATASAGGQLLPPIMGAGAFLMAEILGIRYSEVILAATIPALLYFISVYFMVDFEARKQGMTGLPRHQLPKIKEIAKKAYLFAPVLILIYMLVKGYSVILSGSVGILSCFVVSWLHPSTRMGLKKVLHALELGMKNAIQLIAVVACAGVIVGVIALTGVGLRFSSVLLSIADNNIFLALIFAMGISILLGMGMPTTAAYAVAASVVAPGLIRIGIDPLFAHMFVFYYAVISAITPPVALAAYAAAGISGTDPFKTGVQAFKLGLAAFIVPFMFFYSPQLLLQSESWVETLFIALTATAGVYLLSAAVQAWFFGGNVAWYGRLLLFAASLLLITANVKLDLIAIALVVIVILFQRSIHTPKQQGAV
ncbi:TRAP transporter 4TM/12TM fusion protein [Caldalkalibacillus uzonensis]|uniref:TRAP transporter 4TM/12TM fusion protein n=1 Tax=Caldalkalibacillus uzonensis TaxID=353224 RepID=A0ABU0CNL6_9BACI|nr:TRAP transporter permease [Caldalkalibacillus uzonensis]MDQ0338006.1 TRAP transporter 4TM/12TM fusion protein [Caldalkalibacillus uzonensis]